MSAATLTLIIQGLTAAIAAAPTIITQIENAKALIEGLFSAGVITKETQDALHTHLDTVVAAVLAGQVPPEFAVEADPE